uniref:Macaca fascicularis brain cDNA clone: QflA-23277, similar to human cell division cycle 40 homolog (yeast) (CDC40), mRNA, RefSeq: NM_015891.2 n=1 Tax=Macaca fascicularis TaxID=9541 RepID=I7G7N7_MACFA|nr:unnamed protein product [Macaca fascicularis]
MTFSLVPTTSFNKCELLICEGTKRIIHLNCLVQHTSIVCYKSSFLNLDLFCCVFDCF